MNGLAVTKFFTNTMLLVDSALYYWHGFWIIGSVALGVAALLYIYIETE